MPFGRTNSSNLQLEQGILDRFRCRSPFVQVLVDFISPEQGEPPLRAAFDTPAHVLVATSPEQVREVLDAVQNHAEAGAWCVGYVCYEAATAFDAALVVRSLASEPLAWFAVFDAPGTWPECAAEPAEIDWHSPLKAADAEAAIASIHRRIAEGEVYQINHTARMHGTLRSGNPRSFFAALQRAQPGTYAAFIDTGDRQILSVSPELFFHWRPDGSGQGFILSRPMKGTSGRGATPEEDARNAVALVESVKERAENVMIVDLIRNDLSRISEPHSVKVPRLFHTEALPTVWSMTSDVVGRTRAGTRLADVFAALFPCGSITGAPKVQAMRTIRELESESRGIYCGAVGVVRPGGTATFNVAIRTVEMDGADVRCGIGSGITIDAGFKGEWAEWQHKATFVRRASAPFALLETLCLENGVARHGDAHLQRMAASASHFGYPWDKVAANRALQGLVDANPSGVRRARLLLYADGRIEAESHDMPALQGSLLVSLAPNPLLEAYGEFVRYKTTRRGHYDAFSPAPGYFDTLLWNEAGEVTEFTRGNVAVKIGDIWLTPPLSCGLLPGVGRAMAIKAGEITECAIRTEDLGRAEAVAFLNSLRGWIPVEL